MRGFLVVLLMSAFGAAAQVGMFPTIPVRGITPDVVLFNLPRPPSVWKSTNKSIYAQLLAQGEFDVLVVPCQVEHYALSRSTRSLITARLAAAVAATGRYRVPDPHLVARALGDGERRIHPEEVYALAHKLGVRRIVWSYAGYADPQRSMKFSIQHQDRLDSGYFDMHLEPVTLQKFASLEFSDEVPAIEAFAKVLPEALKSVGIDFVGAEQPVARGSQPSVPSSILEVTKSSGEPSRDARFFQLLAALTPSHAEHTRARFAEKSLLAVLGMSPRSPDYKYLKARAWMYIGERAAAVKTLGVPASAQEKHLLAVLDGNLPAVQQLTPEIKAPLDALVARIDANNLAARYGAVDQQKSRADARALKLKGEAMQLLTERAFTEWSLWEQYDNVALKRLLDREMPIPGFSLNEIAGGIATVADVEKLRSAANLSVLDHVRRLLAANAAKWCCMPATPGPSPLDYLDLFESIATDNLIRHARFLVDVQGSPDSALQFISRIESAYKDHPQLALARASAEARLAKQASGAAREGYLRSAYVNGFNAWYWEQGQTRTAAAAWDVFTGTGRSDYNNGGNAFARELPFRSFYPTWQTNRSDAQRNARAALSNSIFDLQPLRTLRHYMITLDGKPDEFAKLLRSIEGRFAGHPGIAEIRAEASLAKGDLRAAAVFYRDAIKSNPSEWQSYAKLGTLLLEDGNNVDAATVFMSYPGFARDSTENRVGIANSAYEAGSLFFWSGHLDQARPLYQIAADLSTGSDGSLSSNARLALLEGNFMSAAEQLIARAQRYNSVFAFRDYLGMLHAMGHGKQAWEGFDVLARQIQEPQLWESVLVGHRKEGLTVEQVADWASKDPSPGSRYGMSYPAVHVLRAAVTDRRPSRQLPALVAKLERPVWRLEEGERQVVRSGSVLGPDSPRPGRFLAQGVFEKSKKVQIKSDLVYFAEAYAAMRDGKFAAAAALLQDAAQLYDVRNVRLGYLLPYLAFAAAKQGTVEGVEKLLARFEAPQRRFDYLLAQAAIAGLAGKVEQSLEFLKLAKHRRPFTELRPLYTEYQFAEICEWLFDATRDRRYAGVALAWAKANQAAQPWFAWPYAVEARLATNAVDRKRAIAMTHYLDKNSERLAGIAPAEVEAAARSFEKTNPFIVRPRKGETT